VGLQPGIAPAQHGVTLHGERFGANGFAAQYQR